MSYHSCRRKMGMTTARVTTIKISTATRTVTKQHKPRLSLKPLAGLCAAWSTFGGKGLKYITLCLLLNNQNNKCFALKYFHKSLLWMENDASRFPVSDTSEFWNQDINRNMTSHWTSLNFINWMKSWDVIGFLVVPELLLGVSLF